MSYFRDKLAFVRGLADLIEEQADEIGRLRAQVNFLQNGDPRVELQRQVESLTLELHRLRGGSYKSKDNMRYRAKAILTARNNGETYRMIGRRYGISPSRVHQICAEEERRERRNIRKTGNETASHEGEMQ